MRRRAERARPSASGIVTLPPAPDLGAPAGGAVEVSVVIPSYNYGHFIDECLASIYAQRGVRYEIILVDDGSSDDTAARVARHASRITYLRQDNQGQSAARNTGLAACRGRYIQLLDADDLLGLGSLAARVAALQTRGERAMVVCRNQFFSERGSGSTPRTHGAWGLVERDLLIHLLRLNIAPPHAFLMPRMVLDDIGGFDASYRGAEDYDFVLRACAAGYLPTYCATGLVYYRKHTTSMGATKARNRAYPFDVLVHRKKHQGAYGATLAAALETPAGALALSDGVLHTAGIIDPAVNAAGRAEMVTIAKARLLRFMALAEQAGGTLNGTARLFLARIASRADALQRIADPELTELVASVLRRHHRWPQVAANLLSRFPYASYDDQALLAATLRRFLPVVRR